MKKIPYGKQFIDKRDMYAVKKSLSEELITYSATESAFIPVAGWTNILFFLQYSVSILSRPTPNLPIYFKFSAFSKIDWFKFV